MVRQSLTNLYKATNQVEQSFRDNKDITKIIVEIRQKLDDSLMVRVVRIYRDKFFAHLDKKSAMSYIRMDSSSAMKHIVVLYQIQDDIFRLHS